MSAVYFHYFIKTQALKKLETRSTLNALSSARAFAIFLFIFTVDSALASPNPSPSKIQLSFDHSHGLFQKVLNNSLKKENNRVKVNYRYLKENPTELNQYTDTLEKITFEQFNSFNRNQKVAFLINSYNAFAIKLVRDHYPIESIKDIAGLFSSVFNKDYFTLFGKIRSLGWIEHDVLRKDFLDPRIHFAINCAAVSCPDLSESVFTENNLNTLLNQQTRSFINDKSRTSFSEKKSELWISKIFDWFEKDFGGNDESVKKFIAEYMLANEEEKLKMLSENTEIEYLKYDWKLNSN